MRRSSGVVSVVACVVACGLAGRASAQVSQLFELDGEGAGDRFGRSALLCDLDGDGVGEFVVGAPRNDNANGADAGAVYVYSGRTAALIVKLLGDAAGDNLGNSVVRVGDANGDGVDDFAAAASSWFVDGAPQYVRLYSGRYLQDGTPPQVLFDFAPSTTGDLGLSLAAAGDVDGDGGADFIVGDGTSSPDAYVVSGKTGLELFHAIAQGPSDFGLVADGLDDVDGDGFDDFLVGSYQESPNGVAEAGSVWLYSGGPPGTIGTLIDELDGDAALDWFGMWVVRLGDVDGDGIADFAVGASGQPDVNTSIPGYARIYSGATRTEIKTYLGKHPGDLYGWWITAGDLDGDSYLDLVVSARHADDGRRRNTGSITAYSGYDDSILFDLLGHAAGDKLARLDASGDFDGDGAADLLVGGSLVNVNGGNEVGTVYLLSLRARLAAWSNYGSGLAGQLGVPKLEPDVDPALGATVTVTIGNSSGAATFGLLLLGPSKASLPTALGGDLLVAFSTVVAVPFASSLDATITGALPTDVALAGADLYAQALELDAGAWRGVAFSRGLDLALGGAPWN